MTILVQMPPKTPLKNKFPSHKPNQNFHLFSPFECLLTQPQSTGSDTNKALRFDLKCNQHTHYTDVTGTLDVTL